MLGSLMGDEEDVVQRMALASAQFKSLEKVWGRVKSLTTPDDRVQCFCLSSSFKRGRLGSVH